MCSVYDKNPGGDWFISFGYVLKLMANSKINEIQYNVPTENKCLEGPLVKIKLTDNRLSSRTQVQFLKLDTEILN